MGIAAPPPFPSLPYTLLQLCRAVEKIRGLGRVGRRVESLSCDDEVGELLLLHSNKKLLTEKAKERVKEVILAITHIKASKRSERKRKIVGRVRTKIRVNESTSKSIKTDEKPETVRRRMRQDR